MGLSGIQGVILTLVEYVRFTINSKWKTAVLAGLGIAVLSPMAYSQAPKYVPPPPPTKHAKLELRLRYLLQPDIAFSGLGNIPFRDVTEFSNSLVDGTERTVIYDDGYLSQDYINTQLIENSAGQQLVPSGNTEATSSFGYMDPAQVDRDLDPSTLMFHRYSSSLDPTAEFEGRGSGSMGMELNYTKFINRRRNLGVQVGFSFNGFDSRFNDSISADLYTQTFRHSMADGAEVPELQAVEDADGNVTYTPYTGDRIRNADDTNDLLEWLTSEEATEEMLSGGATVDSRADLRSSVYNFRAGPTYAMDLGEAFSFQIGAGLSALYVAGRFSAYEILSNVTANEIPTRAMTTTEDAEWQVGGYLDASAYYNFTERVSLFSGMQVQSGSSYTQENEDRHATVDFSSQIYVHAGLGIKF